jgi:HSP20 family molecular chaperone IbpA
MDLPNVKRKLYATIEHDGKILHIAEEEGEEKEEVAVVTSSTDQSSGRKIKKRFEIRFLLGHNVDANHVSLDFEDAVLTVTAHKITIEQQENQAGENVVTVAVKEHHHDIPSNQHKEAWSKDSYNERFEEAH